MKITVDQILDITGERVPYTQKAIDCATLHLPTIPSDLVEFFTKFGQGDCNQKLRFNPPEKWRSQSHKPYFQSEALSGWVDINKVSGVCFASTDVGDELIATGNENHGILLKSRLYGGFWSLGNTFCDAVEGVFSSPHWDVCKASKVFFNSTANRHPVLRLKKNTALAEVVDRLSKFEHSIEFDNEQSKCFFYPNQHMLISLNNTNDWDVRSLMVVTMRSKPDFEALTKLKVILDELGFQE